MGNLEKIKAEIERRISICEMKRPPLMSDIDFTDEENEINCMEHAYREILSFIDSLQGESIVKDSKVSEEIDQNFTKSSDDDLEKAAFKKMEHFCYDWVIMPRTKRFGLQMFKAGYELGLNARKEE